MGDADAEVVHVACVAEAHFAVVRNVIVAEAGVSFSGC